MYKSAGLPNVEAYALVYTYKTYYERYTGAFYGSNSSLKGQIGSGSAFGEGNMYFDASRSNSIYGNYDTVQPNAITARYYIKY